ncbi:hypothetical protein LINPERPRIM_LOCUS36569 [Linum perenne]
MQRDGSFDPITKPGLRANNFTSVTSLVIKGNNITFVGNPATVPAAKSLPST